MRITPFLLAFGLVVGAAVPAAAVPAATPVDDGAVTIVAAPAFAGVLRPDQSLQIVGAVTNSAAQAMDAGVATVRLDPTAVTSRAAMVAWLDPDGGDTSALGTAIGSIQLGELAAGQTRPFAITIPASSLRLSGSALRVFRISVVLAAGAVELDTARSAVVWTPAAVDTAVDLALVTPVVAPPSTTGILDAATLEELTAPGGLLDVQLTTALAHPIALGVDPMILASIRLLGTSAPPDATAWLERLEAADNDVFSLAYADADLPFLRRAGAGGPLAPIAFTIDPSLFPSGPEDTPEPSDSPTPGADPALPTPESLVAVDSTIEGLAWPGEGPLAEKDLDFLADAGYPRTLVSSSSIATAPDASPDATIGKHDVTILDDAVSGYLRSAADAAGDAEWNSALTALSGILAAAAVEHPGQTLVASLGRSGSGTGTRLGSTLDALESLPWVESARLSEALELPAGSATLTDTDADPDRLSMAERLIDDERAVDRFATVVDEPQLVTGPRRLALLSLFSASWADSAAGWEAAARAYLDDGARIRSAVSIPDSSTITFPLDKGNLPITVRNELDVPVTVYVTVQPERAILDVLDDRVELKIEANSQAKALIPVQSIANGEVRTRLSLSSATGEPISNPTFVVLNVQAGWETAATVVLAAIVVVLFGAGIWRTVLRRRKARAAAPAEETAT
jgi:hypothetical protein